MTDPEHTGAEVQPTRAGATAHPHIDLRRPTCFLVAQLDQERPLDDRILAWGCWNAGPPVPTITTAERLATFELHRTRVSQLYTGPAVVMVWQCRPNEHYRDPPPLDALRLTYPEQEVTNAP